MTDAAATPDLRSGFSLALGAGGGRGWAHIGVVRALQEHDLHPSLIIGSSIGAVIGAGAAMGLPPAQIAAMAERVDVWAECQPRARYAYADPAPLLRRMLAEVGDPLIEELAIPFVATAYDLVTGRQHVIRTGRVSAALVRSTAIPFIFPPRADGHAVYVDAGVWEGVPVSVARELSAHPVVGVEIFGSFTGPLSRWPLRGALRLGGRMLGHGRPGDALTARRYLALLATRITHPHVSLAPDLLIQPDLGWANPMSFHQVARLEQAGYEAARHALRRFGPASSAPATPSDAHA
ncbi:MAG TPA: patatin-like phospholipase family protein [Candidatus Limnocylindria bacterium]|nr:patatin-like phospholipase family protein [Candidatus Limnocylindria bacterium]